MDAGIGISLGSLILSLAIAFNGYRNTRVAQFRKRIEDLEHQLRERIEELEKENERCEKRVSVLEERVEQLREDNQYLLKKLRLEKEGRGG